jgi:hypothetical protein
MTKRGETVQFDASAYLSTTGCGLADGHCWWTSNSGTSNVRPTEWGKDLILCHHTKPLVPVPFDFVSVWNVERTALRQPGGGAVKAYAAPEVSGKSEQARFQSDRFSEMVGCFDMLNGNVPYYDGLGGRVTTLDRADEPKQL